MWINETLDFDSGNYNNNNTFITTVNVYAGVAVS